MIQLRQSDRVMISMWAASASSFLSLPAIFLLPPLLSVFFRLCLIFPHWSLDCRDLASMFSAVKYGCSPAWLCLRYLKSRTLFTPFTLSPSLAPSLSYSPSIPLSLQHVCLWLSAACSGGCRVGPVLFSGCHFPADLWESGRPK